LPLRFFALFLRSLLFFQPGLYQRLPHRFFALFLRSLLFFLGLCLAALCLLIDQREGSGELLHFVKLLT
jgi:hypothetical protein